MMQEFFRTKYWHNIVDGRIQCDVCPRACKLHEGQRGLCFVRACHNNEIVLTTYGRSSGYCIDPVEKKPLNQFLPGTPTLSFGTAGCNLACKFCQNWDISKSRAMDTLMHHASPNDIAKAAYELDCTSVAYTYNDPIVFLEYAIDTAKACKQYGIKSIAVTSGYILEAPRKELFEHMDAANVDLKGFTEDFYRKITGSELHAVLETLLYLKHETKVWLEITTLLIPDENDSVDEITNMTSWIYDNLGPDVPLHFTAFHPDWKMLDKTPTPVETLIQARQIALDRGLNYVYTGNAHNVAGETTICKNCKKAIIVRDWYKILNYNLDDHGCCQYCHTKCDGVFSSHHGIWGDKRQEVHLG